MIRLFLVAFILISFLILSIPIMLVEMIIGKFNPRLKDISSLRLVQAVFRLIMFVAGTKMIIIGEENIPKDTAVMYVGNHRSYFDVVMTYMRVPRLTGYIAKKEMLRWPLLPVWMKFLHCLFLDRDKVKEGLKVILAAIDKVKNGISICVFPEGTRNKEPDTMLPFHEGSFKIASKGQVPIIPMSIVNSAAIFEDHLPWIKKAKIVIEYLPPVYVSDLDKDTQKHVGTYISELILDAYKKNKKQYFG